LESSFVITTVVSYTNALHLLGLKISSAWHFPIKCNVKVCESIMIFNERNPKDW